MVSTLGFIPATPEEVAERLATKMAIVRVLPLPNKSR